MLLAYVSRIFCLVPMWDIPSAEEIDSGRMSKRLKKPRKKKPRQRTCRSLQRAGSWGARTFPT